MEMRMKGGKKKAGLNVDHGSKGRIKGVRKNGPFLQLKIEFSSF